MTFTKDELLRRIAIFNEGPHCCKHCKKDQWGTCKLDLDETYSCYRCPKFELDTLYLSKEYSYEMLGVK